MVEGHTNIIILDPVKDRMHDTLVKIIKKHVAPGSKIYSDSFRSYDKLNGEGPAL